jgi:membrane protein DedA with SNARE-associated domain
LGSFGSLIHGRVDSLLAVTGRYGLLGFLILEGAVSPEFFFTLFFLIAIPYAVGVTTASFFFYGLLYFFGERGVRKWGKWFGVSWNDIERLRGGMKRTYWDELTLLFLRIVPLVPSAALASICGFVKMRIVPYVLITLVGVTVRACIFASLGWYLGETYRRYAKTIAGVESFIGYSFLFLFICSLVFIFLYTQRRSKNVLQ